MAYGKGQLESPLYCLKCLVLSWMAASAVAVAPTSRYRSHHLLLHTVMKTEATLR